MAKINIQLLYIKIAILAIVQTKFLTFREISKFPDLKQNTHTFADFTILI